MPREMSRAEILAFLMEAPRTGQVATVRADGRPHVAPVWFTVDGADVVFATSSDTVKARNLRRTGFAAFSVDDDTPPFSYAVVEGPVTVIDDMEQVKYWAGVAAARYIGTEEAAHYIQLDSFPDDLICRLTPSHMTGHAEMAT